MGDPLVTEDCRSREGRGGGRIRRVYRYVRSAALIWFSNSVCLWGARVIWDDRVCVRGGGGGVPDAVRWFKGLREQSVGKKGCFFFLFGRVLSRKIIFIYRPSIIWFIYSLRYERRVLWVWLLLSFVIIIPCFWRVCGNYFKFFFLTLLLL